MQIGKWLYRTKVYFYLIFNYWIFPWRLQYYEIDIVQIVNDEWNSMHKWRIRGTIFKGLIHIDFRPYNGEFWWGFLHNFMFVGDTLTVMALPKIEQINSKRTIKHGY